MHELKFASTTNIRAKYSPHTGHTRQRRDPFLVICIGGHKIKSITTCTRTFFLGKHVQEHLNKIRLLWEFIHNLTELLMIKSS